MAVALPSIQDLHRLMTQVFPGVPIKVVRIRIATGLRILLEAQLDCAKLTLAVVDYWETEGLSNSARLYLTDTDSRILLKERLDLNTPSDLIGGLSLTHQVYEQHQYDYMYLPLLEEGLMGSAPGRL